MDKAKYLGLFISEAKDHIEAAGRQAALFSWGIRSPESLNAMFRHFHSIKGMAASMGFSAIGALSHAAEDLLDHARKFDIAAGPDFSEPLLESIDRLSALIDACGRDDALEPGDTKALVARLREFLVTPSPSPTPPPPDLTELAIPIPRSSPGDPPEPEPPRAAETQATAEAVTVRIPAAALDRFLDAMSELMTRRGVLRETLLGRNVPDAAAALAKLSESIDRLREEVMTLRLLPFEHIVPRLEMTVRDLCRRTGRRAALEITGSDVALDRSILEELLDPLTHLLRNAVDHGLEPPESRERAGKPALGRIRIGVAREGERVLVTVADDGKGMNLDAIRVTAVAAGFVSPEELASLDDERTLMLTTIPGFSTAGDVSDVSGRGVGMDVVRTRVESLRGQMRITTHDGEGTSIQMNLPLTVALIDAFLVEAASTVFAIPASCVESVQLLDPGRIQQTPSGVFLREGKEATPRLTPLISLTEFMGGPAASWSGDDGAVTALLCQVDSARAALTVGRIRERCEMMAQPLGAPLDRLRRYSGTALLDDGTVALILDVARITGGGS